MAYLSAESEQQKCYSDAPGMLSRFLGNKSEQHATHFAKQNTKRVTKLGSMLVSFLQCKVSFTDLSLRPFPFHHINISCSSSCSVLLIICSFYRFLGFFLFFLKASLGLFSSFYLIYFCLLFLSSFFLFYNDFFSFISFILYFPYNYASFLLLFFCSFLSCIVSCSFFIYIFFSTHRSFPFFRPFTLILY